MFDIRLTKLGLIGGLLLIFIVGAIPVAASIARFVSFATLDWPRDIPCMFCVFVGLL